MGFNIAGFAIDKNYKDEVASLSKIIGGNLVFEEEVDFEEASENWKEGDYFDIYFSENGTLIFTPMENAEEESYSLNRKILSFIMCETSMAFKVTYTENNELIRDLMSADDRILTDDGDAFDFEKEENDTSNLIFHLIEKTIGKKYWDIEMEEVCYRYSI